MPVFTRPGGSSGTVTVTKILNFDETNFLDINPDGSINVNATATDFDIRNLTFVQDKVDVSGSNVNVTGLTFSGVVITGVSTEAKQDTQIGLLTTIDGDTSVLAGTVSGSELQVDIITIPTVTVTATNLDTRDLTFASDKVDASGTVLGASTNNIGDVDVLTVPVPLSTSGGGTEATALRVTLASDSTGLVSVDDNGGSLTIDAASLPLPTGAATAALQTQPGVDIGDVTVNNASGASAVNIQDGGNSITVDGPLTNTELRASQVTVSGVAEIEGIAIGNFLPSTDATFPTYSTPGVSVRPTVDIIGNLNTRSQVLTDEQSFRDHFEGSSLDSSWTSSVGTGGSITVGSGTVVITSGGTEGSSTYISRPSDYMPLVLSVKFFLTSRAAASTGRNFFIGLFNDPNPTLATSFVRWVFLGVGGNTTSECHGQAHTGTGGLEGTGTNVGVTTTVSDFFKQIALDCDSAIFRDGSVTLPSGTTQATRSADLPGMYEKLYVCAGFTNSGVSGATGVTATIDTVFVKNTNRLIVNTGF